MIQRTVLRSSRLFASSHSPARPFSALSQSQIISSRIPASARARVAARWYSDAAKNEKPSDAEKKSDTNAKSEEDPMKKQLEAKDKEIVTLKDQYLRSVAEYRNLQDRSKREQEAARNFAIQKFAKDLVESVDNFDLALTNVPKEKLESTEEAHKDLKDLHSGLKMVERVMLATLKKHGLERFDPSEAGDKFDPNVHEATFQTPQPDKEDGTCFYTTQKGFMLNGRTLRAAKVGVVKNS